MVLLLLAVEVAAKQLYADNQRQHPKCVQKQRQRHVDDFHLYHLLSVDFAPESSATIAFYAYIRN